MAILKNFKCTACNHKDEDFDGDEQTHICPRCASADTWYSVFSPSKIASTTSRTQPTNLTHNFAPAGIAFRVKSGVVVGGVPIVAGEVIDLEPGEKSIVSLTPDMDSEAVQFLAKKMFEKPKKEKEKMH